VAQLDRHGFVRDAKGNRIGVAVDASTAADQLAMKKLQGALEAEALFK